ncbi:MAG: undecaprenyl/decaprenyl-phosphate alpha-N-acetylglucosaminyl 1-phosphate transferase [Elusimicrobiales bacterium]|nr:undecaprenyl/decaprenyl-phosphate alpha-N-acetylglucosaminyl 1-phosphate transferase [Elusimicrobiales bacterium]
MTRKLGSIFPVVTLAVLLVLLPPGGFSAWTWTEGLRWAYLFLIAFSAALLLSPLSAWLAARVGAMDIPNARKVHAFPIPRAGGLAVYLAFMAAVLRNMQFSTEIYGILIGGTIIFVLGFVDDCRGLSARTRIFWQVLAALIVTFFGLRLSFPLSLPLGGAVSTVLSVAWLVGIVNAFNFMDGIDGLASTMGAVCALLFLGIGWNSSQYPLSFISAALAGACAGFLRSNWRPASIFLGDSGSTFIGFILGCLALYGGWATDNPAVAFSTPLLVLGIPIFDIIYTTVSRVRNGSVSNLRQWLEYAGRDHFHHRLMKLGLGVEQTVGFIVLLNVALGLGAWTIRHTASTLGTWFLLAQSVLIFLVVVVLMLLGREIVPQKDDHR